MRVRVTMPNADGKRLREKILEGAEKVEVDEMGQNEWELVGVHYAPMYLSLLTKAQADHTHRP